MKRLAVWGIATLVAVLALASARPAAADTVELVPGCQIVSLVAYPIGDALANVTADIDGGTPRLWFLTPGTTEFSLFDPRSAERSAKTTLGPDDEAAFLCVDAAVTWDRGASAGAEPPPPPPAPPPPQPTPVSQPGLPPSEPTPGYSARRVTTYLDFIDLFHVVGEVVNDSGSNGTSVLVHATFTDSAGNVVTESAGLSCLDLLPAGGDSPFDVLFFDPPPAGSTYTLVVSAEPATAAPATGLVLSDVTAGPDEVGAYHVTGTVTNQSTVTYQVVTVCGALYDAQGNVIRSSPASVVPTTLAPGESASFDYFEFDVEPASHRLWVDGAQ